MDTKYDAIIKVTQIACYSQIAFTKGYAKEDGGKDWFYLIETLLKLYGINITKFHDQILRILVFQALTLMQALWFSPIQKFSPKKTYFS